MLRFHHSGFVVEDIDSWEKKIFFERKIADVIDPVQNARLSLYRHFADNSFIELIQPMDESAFTWASLKRKGNHFNHFCYQADSKEEVLSLVDKQKFIPVLGPVPAVLFKQEPVFFFYTRNKQIIEFLISSNENWDFY